MTPDWCHRRLVEVGLSALPWYTSTCSAIARASSTSMARYLTVLSILVWPSRSWTALRLPVRGWIRVALVRRSECVPNSLGSSRTQPIHSETRRAYWRDGDDITATQLAVDRQVEHSEVASPAFD